MEIWKRNMYICWFGVLVTSTGLNQVTPIIPLYLHELGIKSIEATAEWSGWATGICYIIMALVAPFWGKQADLHGRKMILLRASFGMALTSLAMGFVQTPLQFILCRLLQGLVSGFYSGAITLIATQTPSNQVGWALGMLSTGSVGGILLGPLFGGYVASIYGLRSIFYVAGALLFIAFALILCLIKDNANSVIDHKPSIKEVWCNVPQRSIIIAMFISTFIYAVGLMSFQPVVAIYIYTLMPSTLNLALISGAVFSITGVAQIISSSFLGKVIDRIGSEKVIFYSLLITAATTIPQGYVTNVYQLSFLRFLLGFGIGGLLPAINAFISKAAPVKYAGLIFGYNQAAQFTGFFIGSIAGSMLVAHDGFRSLFWFTGLLFIANALWVYRQIYSKNRPIP